MKRARLAAILLALAGGACGSGPDDQSGFARTPLQQAVLAQDLERVRSLIAEGAALGRSQRLKQNAWYTALDQVRDEDPRTLEVAALVLDATAARLGTTPRAVVSQGIRLWGGSRSTGPPVYRSPAELMVGRLSGKGMQFLVDKGLDLGAPGTVAAWEDAVHGSCVACAAALLDAGMPVDTTGPKYRTLPLGAARAMGNPDMAALLSSRGASGRVGPTTSPSQVTRRVADRRFPGKGAMETWIEGPAIADHPAGRLVLQVASQNEPKFPPVDAVVAGFAAGSVLMTHGAETEIRLIRFPNDVPQEGARTTVMEIRVRTKPDGSPTVAYEQ
ncbi:MAG: hypothetical protein ABW221_08155 [Vicinamibacteria bacterium]